MPIVVTVAKETTIVTGSSAIRQKLTICQVSLHWKTTKREAMSLCNPDMTGKNKWKNKCVLMTDLFTWGNNHFENKKRTKCGKWLFWNWVAAKHVSQTAISSCGRTTKFIVAFRYTLGICSISLNKVCNRSVWNLRLFGLLNGICF